MKRMWISALLLAGCLLVSCGNESRNDIDTQPAERPDSTEAAETTGAAVPLSLLDQMPEADYGGYAYNILLNDQDNRYVDIMTEDKETGDTLNDLVYRRNRAVEEKYNIKIVGKSDEYPAVNNTLKKEVQAGLNDYDLYFSNGYATALASEGFLYAYNDLPHLALSELWWDQTALKGLSVGGKIYLATGDISPTSLLTSSCLVFNKNLFAANDMEFPYALAAEGKWTIDRLVEMTKGLTRDLNGDGKYVFGEDLFAFSSWMCDSPISLFYGAGGMLSQKTADDMPELSLDVDRISSIYNKMYQIIIENNSYFVTDPTQYETAYQNFANGSAYICEITLQKIDLFLRDMKDDYGILPIPKWDEAQDVYLSCVNAAGSLVVVPNNAEDPERTGMVMEALAESAYEMISPSLFEVITKTKNVRDQESADMVELITRQRVFDPIHINLIEGWNFCQSMLQSKKTDVASTLARQEKGMRRALDKIIDAYMKNE